MHSDYKELLFILNERGVRYLIVGAYAVAVHAQPRATKDLDILVHAEAGNAKAVFAALSDFGAPLKGMTSDDFAESGPFFRMGQEPMGIDVLTSVPGVEFDEAWERRIVAVVDPVGGLEANFISREDLIAAKLASGRLQDLADVEAIRAAMGS